jgi:hypothetical protein
MPPENAQLLLLDDAHQRITRQEARARTKTRWSIEAAYGVARWSEAPAGALRAYQAGLRDRARGVAQ